MYGGYHFWKSIFFERQTKEHIIQEKDQNFKAQIKKLEIKYDALINWPEGLVNANEFRDRPIFTIELQKLWIDTKPIIFIGNLIDISRIEKNKVEVTIKFDKFREHLILDSLFIKLTCDSAKAEKIVSEAPNLDNYLSSNIVAVAKIKTVESFLEAGKQEKLLTGFGECLELIPIYK